MTTSEDFVNWLEGFLDACKNSPTPMQIREVRKKISALRQSTEEFQRQVNDEFYNPLWNSTISPQPTRNYSTITLVQPPKDEIYSKNTEPVNEDFIKAIEKNKDASTMEELTN